MNTVMKPQKRCYSVPKLFVFGSLVKITQQGGSSNVDVPIGTPIGSTISSVVS